MGRATDVMPAHTADIAAALNDIADLLDIAGANPFRIRAYRNAARTVGELGQPPACRRIRATLPFAGVLINITAGLPASGHTEKNGACRYRYHLWAS